MDHDPAVKILDQAAVVLERDGWIQGQLGNGRVGRCLSAAIYAAACELGYVARHPDSSGVARYALGQRVGFIPQFNDHVCETVEDALLALKEARTDLEGAT